MLLVGLKSDLRNDAGADLVGSGEARKLVACRFVDAYVECSALDGTGIDFVLETAARVCLGDDMRRAGKGKGKQCAVM